MGNLAAMLESVTEMQRRYQELNVAVEQRLKWACGANPEVQEVFNSYSTAFVGQAAALKALSAVMKAAGGAAGAVLQVSDVSEILARGGSIPQNQGL